MIDRDIERDIHSIRRMVAWITGIMIVGALCIVMAAVGFYIEGQRQSSYDSTITCIENPGTC